jgi:hypothetical protein
MKVLSLFSIIVILLTMPLIGSNFKSKGEVALENRLFSDDDLAITKDGNLDLFARLESSFKSGPFRAGFRVFGRADKGDRQRSIIAIEEAWIGFCNSGWDIKLGAQMLNWSATEAFHPADMINSRLLDSDIEKPEKFGEVMLSVNRKIGRGSLTAFIMPRYEAPEFPSSRSRLNFFPTGLEVGNELWLERDGEISSNSYGLQWGLRFSQTLGAADISLHYIEHQDRSQPLMLMDNQNGMLHPMYFPVRDIGGTLLRVFGGWIVKLEYDYRDFINPENPVQVNFAGLVPVKQLDHSQLALGLEYGWTYSGGGEGTLIVEGQRFFGVNKIQRATLHPFQSDILIGYRHAWNDILGRELLVTTIIDIERKHEYLLNVSYSQRLNDTWGVRLGFRLVDAPVKGDFPIGLETLHKSNQVFLVLTKYF